MTKSSLSLQTLLIPSIVRDESQIYPGHSEDVEANIKLIAFWMCVSRKPEAVILSHEREKKKKYLQAFLDQRRHVSPIAVSFDGVLGNEAKVQEYNKTSPRNQESTMPKLQTS